MARSLVSSPNPQLVKRDKADNKNLLDAVVVAVILVFTLPDNASKARFLSLEQRGKLARHLLPYSALVT